MINTPFTLIGNDQGKLSGRLIKVALAQRIICRLVVKNLTYVTSFCIMEIEQQGTYYFNYK